MSQETPTETIQNIRDECLDAIEDARSKILYLRDDLEATKEDVISIQDTLESKADLNHVDEQHSTIETNVQTIQELDEKLTIVASQVIQANRKLRQLESKTESIQNFYKQASQKQVQKGVCSSCDHHTDIAYINNAECPNCNVLFVDVKTSRFGVDEYICEQENN